MKQSFKKGFGVTLGTLTANLLFTIAAKLAAEKLRNSSLEGLFFFYISKFYKKGVR